MSPGKRNGLSGAVTSDSEGHDSGRPPRFVWRARQPLLQRETEGGKESVLKRGLLCNPSQGPFAIFVPGSARHGWVFSPVTRWHL